MAEATQHLQIVISAQDQASGVLRGLSGALGGLVTQVKQGIGLGIGFNVAQQVADAFREATDAVVGFNSTLEQSRIGWETMLGGAAQADTMLRQLQNFAASTPFEFIDVERAARRFVAMGFAAQDVIPLMRSVGAAAAALGGGADTIDRISRALGQMSTRTKVTAEDMMQLTEAGVPAWRILADATGTSVAQIQDAVTKGTVSADVMINAFQQFAELNWAKLLDVQTFQVAMSNIHDSIQQLLAGAFRPLFKGLEDLAIRFADFLRSDDVSNFANSVANAQNAIGLFLQAISQSTPILTTFAGALGGIATVLGVQIVAAAGRATLALVPMVAMFVAANAPMIALGVAAAAAGVVIAASWDQIVQGTDELRTALAQRLTEFVNWLGGSLAPALGAAARAGWEMFANTSLGALTAVVSAWNQFWGQEIGPSGETAFAQLQRMAAEGWGGFVDIAIAAFNKLMVGWSALVGFLQGLRAMGVELVGIWGAIADQTVDATKATDEFANAIRQVPSLAGRAFSGFQKFVADDLPEAFQRAVEMVRAAGGDLADIWPKVLEVLQSKMPTLANDALQGGKTIGSALGNGILQGVKPLLEELANLIARQAAGPATEALADAQAELKRVTLVLADMTQAPGAQMDALRRKFELEHFVIPSLELESFDVNEPVRKTQEALDRAQLRINIDKTTAELQGVKLGAPTAVLAAAPAPGQGPTGAAAVPPMTQQIIVNVIEPDGTTRIYEELIEANGQSQMPPVIQVSAVRRA